MCMEENFVGKDLASLSYLYGAYTFDVYLFTKVMDLVCELYMAVEKKSNHPHIDNARKIFAEIEDFVGKYRDTLKFNWVPILKRIPNWIQKVGSGKYNRDELIEEMLEITSDMGAEVKALDEALFTKPHERERGFPNDYL